MVSKQSKIEFIARVLPPSRIGPTFNLACHLSSSRLAKRCVAAPLFVDVTRLICCFLTHFVAAFHRGRIRHHSLPAHLAEHR